MIEAIDAVSTGITLGKLSNETTCSTYATFIWRCRIECIIRPPNKSCHIIKQWILRRTTIGQQQIGYTLCWLVQATVSAIVYINYLHDNELVNLFIVLIRLFKTNVEKLRTCFDEWSMNIIFKTCAIPIDRFMMTLLPFHHCDSDFIVSLRGLASL